jgi:hypothetical protein
MSAVAASSSDRRREHDSEPRDADPSRAHYAEHLSLEAARAEYFRANGFGEDGGYSAAWVDFMLGPIPFPFPNSKERVRALRYHDLHHIVTGYRTDFTGELEISAFEVASGCEDMVVAWALNLGGTAAGALFVAPRRTFRAFVRGRRAKNLYRTTCDEALLARTVGDVRSDLGLASEPGPARASDVLAYVGFVAIGLVVGSSLLAVLAPLAPIGWIALQIAARKRR